MKLSVFLRFGHNSVITGTQKWGVTTKSNRRYQQPGNGQRYMWGLQKQFNWVEQKCLQRNMELGKVTVSDGEPSENDEESSAESSYSTDRE